MLRRTGLLASVADLGEMRHAIAGGADVIDLKDPRAGTLGAWTPDALRDAVALWRGLEGSRPLLCATAGDGPLVPDRMVEAVERVAEAGVPLVRIGLPASDDAAAFSASLAALAPRAARTPLVAVLFADRAPDLDRLRHLKAAGFRGAMLDTADKVSGGLRRHLTDGELSLFVASARILGLMCGLAGSLTLEDVAPLTALAPDYLGFRGALCGDGDTDAFDPARLAAIRRAMDAPAG